MSNTICRTRTAANAWRTWKKDFLGGVHNVPITVHLTLQLQFILFQCYLHLLGSPPLYGYNLCKSIRVITLSLSLFFYLSLPPPLFLCRVYVCVHMCIYMWRPKVDIKCLPQFPTLPLILLRDTSHWSCSSAILQRLGGLSAPFWCWDYKCTCN